MSIHKQEGQEKVRVWLETGGQFGRRSPVEVYSTEFPGLASAVNTELPPETPSEVAAQMQGVSEDVEMPDLPPQDPITPGVFQGQYQYRDRDDPMIYTPMPSPKSGNNQASFRGGRRPTYENNRASFRSRSPTPFSRNNQASARSRSRSPLSTAEREDSSNRLPRRKGSMNTLKELRKKTLRAIPEA